MIFGFPEVSGGPGGVDKLADFMVPSYDQETAKITFLRIACFLIFLCGASVSSFAC